MLRLIFCVFLLLDLGGGDASALDKDFFNRQKKIKQERKRRLKGAAAYTKKRKRLSKAKGEEAAKYRAVRKQQGKKLKQAEARFEKDFNKPPTTNKAQMQAAIRYAKRKRKKNRAETWQNQNLEYDIEVIKPKPKK